MLKKSITSLAMIGAVALALASSGGGDKTKSTITSGRQTAKSTPGFSLQAGRSYSNALVVNKTNTAAAHTIITYRKGNTIYIVPPACKGTYKPVASKNNLNMLNLKLNLSNK